MAPICMITDPCVFICTVRHLGFYVNSETGTAIKILIKNSLVTIVPNLSTYFSLAEVCQSLGSQSLLDGRQRSAGGTP